MTRAREQIKLLFLLAVVVIWSVLAEVVSVAVRVVTFTARFVNNRLDAIARA